MGRIRRLDDHLATLIAAGEVVAGPVSVVRELVDNALDAGATSIDVAVEEGGLRSIRVADNGQGMDEADAVLCLARHATSKLAAPEDLASILTLGFRGEALAAIAAVSHLKLETRRAEDSSGTGVRAAGGTVSETRPVARRPGTTIEVGHLFYNTPARREFQDSARAESARVLQAVERLAVARPAVRFTFRDGDRALLDAPPAADLLERIRQLHGDELADAMIPVRAQRGDISVTGYVARPAAAVRRPRRNTFLVNGRPFESFEIRRLLTTTFAHLVPHGHHVEAVLSIELPPAEVDVNVSPDKSQVRFRRAGQLLAAVTDALHFALGDRAATAILGTAGSETAAARERPVSADVAARIAALRRYESEEAGRADTWEQMFGGDREPAPPARVAEPREPWPATPAPAAARHGIPANPAVVLQVSNSFLVCTTDDGMLIVDQHSAHERVNYERFREQLAERGRNQDVQPLMFPETLSLDAGGAALLEEMQPYLERLGFELSSAGPRQHLVQAVPAALGERSVTKAIAALMEAYSDARALGIRSAEVGDGINPVEDRLLKTMACHAAVKAGQPLADAEVRSLWRSLVGIDLACHDVHGRPGVLHLPAAEIARRMGR